MRRLAAAAVVMALATVALSAQTAGTGRVAGRMTSTAGDVLPGVTVTVSGGGPPATVVSDAEGRFLLEVFVNGSSPLTLSTSLPGFQNTTRDIRARPGGTVNLGDVRLPVSCLAIVDYVATGLREEASRALTVAHLRIEAVEPLREWTIGKSCYTGSEVRAVVMTDLRGRRAGSLVRFVPIKSPAKPPYKPGDEIVVALYRDSASGPIYSSGYGYGVSDGVVSLLGAGPLDEFEEEVPVAVLFERLRDGAAARRR